MTLYHFTAEHLARQILREGITKGVIPLFDQRGRFTGIRRGYIWLTSDPDFASQEWCAERHLIPYDRAAVRLTVEIPPESEYNASLASDLLPREFSTSAFLLETAGSDKWRIYRGKVFRKWITAIEHKPMVATA